MKKILKCEDCKKEVSVKEYNKKAGLYYCEECGQIIKEKKTTI